MTLSPRDAGRRYSPLLLLVIAQLVLAAVRPSTPPATTATREVAAGRASRNGRGGTTAGAAGAAGGNTAAGDAADAAATPSGPAASVPGAQGTGPGGGDSGTGPSDAGAGPGGPVDRSHCDAHGREIGPSVYMPSCVPVWHGGDNGGATMTGVTASKVNFLVWAPMANAQVNAILAQDDLAANPNQFCPAYQAFTDDLNKRWEFYGRKLTPLDGPGNHSGLSQNGCSFPYFQSQCQSLPPDPPCLRAEADVIASMHPAFVIAPISVSALYDELGRKKIVVAGGQAEPDQYHDAVAPYYWDVFMGGTRLARMAADYWCKKLVGRPVRYAGSEVLHPDGNPLGAVPKRKLGIVYPETNGDPTYKINIDEFQRLITGGECGSGADAPKRYTYQFDINTAEQQSLTTVAALKKDHITTMMCACDAIAPVFLTTTLAAQNYHPEQLLMGVGLMDYDALAQLYNGSVWKYAFGVSSLGDPVAFADSQAAVAWRDAGRQGLPDNTENLYWSYFVLMGNAFQAAGPRVTPGAIEQALFSLDPGGGDHVNPLIEFGRPNDHTGIRDSREVYWCTSPPSPINGHRGHYVSVDGGKRRQVGEWPSGDPAVFPNGPC